jgi:hypothetical protein
VLVVDIFAFKLILGSADEVFPRAADLFSVSLNTG